MLVWNRYGLSVLLLIGTILALMHHFRIPLSFDILYKLDVPEEAGSFSVVKDFRGVGPYVTIKMRCFYEDNIEYGKTWKTIMETTNCHEVLFHRCFQNRTVHGRQETHVLTFNRVRNVKKCMCTDIARWCLGICTGIPIIQCCLDKGKTPVLCRR